MTDTALISPAHGPWRQALREEWLRWSAPVLFVAKTVLAALLALWIALRLDLPSPSSAMITVFIVAQPSSGLVLEKSFYRLIGTVIGSLVTLLLVAALPQQRGLFVGAMALWIGACTAGATWFRNFQSYAFLLAGYTAALVGFSAVQAPDQALQIAVDRVSVVALGILCAGFISDGLFPQRLSARLVSLVRGRSLDLYTLIRQSLSSTPSAGDSSRRHAELIASVFAFESSRSAAAVEDPEARARSARLQRLNAQFMAVTSTLHTLERWLQRESGDTALVDALRPATEALRAALLTDDGEMPRMAVQAQTVLPGLRAARLRMPALLAAGRTALPTGSQRDFDSAAALLRQLGGELIGYTETFAALYRTRESHPRPAPRYLPSVDPRAALLNGLRTALVLLVTTSFWIITAWPDAVLAVVNATVFCALFASVPDPTASIRGLLRGFGLGFIAAAVCGLWVLPQLDGFPLLAVALGVFMLPGVWWLAQPAWAGSGTGYLLMFTVSLSLGDVMHYDPARLLNSGIAQFIGVYVALIGFTVILPASSVRSQARWLSRLRSSLADACRLPLRGLRHRFENGSRDLLQQVQPASPAQVDAALRILEAGHAVLALRRALADSALPEKVRRPVIHGLRALARWLDQPRERQRHLAEALDSLRSALDAMDSDDGLRPHRAAAALHRLRSVVRAPDFRRALGEEAPHAA